MKYMGSKNRHATELLEIILKDRKENQWYVEPFVGGCNIIDKVKGNRIGNDIHYHLIELFKSVQDGWHPPDSVDEFTYNYLKDNYKTDSTLFPDLVGFVGFGCSYSGKWFGGYARGKNDKGTERNYCLESKNNIMKQVEGLKDVALHHGDYRDLVIPENSIIYCDIPYKDTTKYQSTFDHDLFWEWCDTKVTEGHKVYVSEYTAPDHWECVWEKKVNNSLTKETGSKQGYERLFVPKK